MDENDEARAYSGRLPYTDKRVGAAACLAGENLEPYSQDELAARIALLEAEIARVKAHGAKAAAHRLAAEAFFKPKA